MELRSIDLLNGLLTAQSWAGSLRGFFMEEIWKTVEKAPNYEVSNIGRVRNKKTGKLLKQAVHENGCLHIKLSINNKAKHYYVHRLILEVFEGPSHLTVDHINGIKTDNRLENLSYCSDIENIARYHTNRKDVRGYTYHKLHRKYQSSRRLNGKYIYLGAYETEEEARAVYEKHVKDDPWLDNISRPVSAKEG
jgi:hypothetical protein